MSKSSGSFAFIVIIIFLGVLFILGANNLKHNFFGFDGSTAVEGTKAVNEFVDRFRAKTETKKVTSAQQPRAKPANKSRAVDVENQKDVLEHRDRAELNDLLDEVSP